MDLKKQVLPHDASSLQFANHIFGLITALIDLPTKMSLMLPINNVIMSSGVLIHLFLRIDLFR